MHKSATKCNETVGKWCKNKHGVSKIIDTLETYQGPPASKGPHGPEGGSYMGLVSSPTIPMRTRAEPKGFLLGHVEGNLGGVSFLPRAADLTWRLRKPLWPAHEPI
jgi:hypothetical protein